jgi:hypothetical protein
MIAANLKRTLEKVILFVCNICIFFPRIIYRHYQNRCIGSYKFTPDCDILYISIPHKSPSTELNFLSHLTTKCQLTIASDNAATRKEAIESDVVDNVVWINNMDTSFRINKDVKLLTRKLDTWIKQLDEQAATVCKDWPHIYPNLGPGRSLEETLLWVRSYKSVIESENPDYLIVQPNQDQWCQSKALTIISNSVDVDTIEMPTFLYRITRSYGFSSHQSSVLYLPAVYLVSRAVNQLINIIVLVRRVTVAKFSSVNSFKMNRHISVGFFIYRNSSEFLKKSISIIKGFGKVPDISPIAILYNKPGLAKKLNNENIDTVQLEYFYPTSQFISDTYMWLRVVYKAHSTINQLDEDTYNYGDISLSPVIQPLILEYLHRNFIDNIRYARCVKQYLNQQHLSAVNSAGGGVSKGRIWISTARDQSSSLAFYYDAFPIYVEQPYFEDTNDIYFAIGSLEKERFVNQGVASERIKTVGLEIGSETGWGIKNCEVDGSREKLGLTENQELTLFYAPSWHLPGRNSQRETITVFEQLLEFASTHMNVDLVVKPHPSDQTGTISQVADQYTKENIHVIDRDVDVDHCINCSDIVITKFSMVGLDALLAEKGLITVAIDNDPDRWLRQYDGAAEKFSNLDLFISFLQTLVEDPMYRNEWLEEQSNRRTEFIRKNIRPTSESAIRVAEDVRDHATDYVDGNKNKK